MKFEKYEKSKSVVRKEKIKERIKKYFILIDKLIFYIKEIVFYFILRKIYIRKYKYFMLIKNIKSTRE